MRRALALATLFSLLASAGPTRANGRFPAAQHFVGGPPGAGQVLAVRTTFGVLVSEDRGRGWRYLCEDVLGIANTATWDAPLELASDGALFAGLPDGLVRVTDGCSAPRVAEVGTNFTADLTRTADGATLYWLGSSGPQGNRVLASTDGGRSFEPRGTVPDGVLLETIEASDLDPRRVYLTGVGLDAAREFQLYRSDDGARTFRASSLGVNGLVGAYLAGLDPGSVDGIWVRAVERSADGRAGGTLLLHSRDGGTRFETVTRTRGPMLGFAIREGVVWFGGPDDGLWRLREGEPPTRIADLPITCLRWHEGALYACANHLRTGWAVARSLDEGRRFEPILRFEDLTGPPRCPAGTIGGDLCPGRWSVLRRTLVPDAGLAAPIRDGGTMDASLAPAPTPRGDCGCAVPTAAPSTPGIFAAMGLTCAALLRRRRRGVILRAACAAPSSR